MSPSGQYALITQYNGDVDLYNLGDWFPYTGYAAMKPLWSSKTSPNTSQPAPSYRMGLSSVGIIVQQTTSSYQVITNQHVSGETLKVMNNGNVELLSPSGAILWQTNTGG